MIERTAAAEIIAALGGNQNTGMCRCPAHDDNTPSLHVKEGDKTVVFKCHANCSQEAIMDALTALGLWGHKQEVKVLKSVRRAQAEHDAAEEEFERFRRVMSILRAAAKTAPPAAYLKHRGLTLVPENARLLSASESARVTGKHLPAMVLPILDAAELLVGAHVTSLTRDGAQNARGEDGKSVRRTFGIGTGQLRGGLIKFGGLPYNADKPLIVAEGVETALSASQLTGLPAVAAVSAGNMAAITLPPCSEVIIAADNDPTGRKAASALAERLEYEGCKVRLALPPGEKADWNDLLRRDAAAAKAEWQNALVAEAEREHMALNHPVEDFLELTFPKREMLMAPWLPQPGVGMLFASAGHAKTFLALGIAFAVTRGEDFLGWRCERQGRVLYIDGEMPGSYLQERLTLYGKAPKETLFIVCRDTFNLRREMMPDLGTPEGRRIIDEIIKEVKPDLIIVDSLSTLVRTGEESKAEDWVPVQDWVMKHRWRGRTVLLVHHAGKNKDQRGTSKRLDTPETVIKLTKRGDIPKQDDESAFELEFIKGRELFGTSEESMTFWLAVHNGRIKWRHETTQDVRMQKICELRAAGWTHADIAKELGLSRSWVTTLLKRAQEKDEREGDKEEQEQEVVGKVFGFPPKGRTEKPS